MPLISVVLNVDTRPENDTNERMFNGVVSRDFLYDGVLNKKKLFEGFDHEIIVFVDEHEPLTEVQEKELRGICDTLIIRKHNKQFEEQQDFAAFNDLNYLTALFSARGKYIFHFDGDIAAFASSPESVQDFINGLEKYTFISYPSLWSPYPTHDESFDNKYWVSTRFFCCKRSSLNFGELLKCQLDYDYWRTTYPVPRLCHWSEHLISSIAHNTGGTVFYPPVQWDRFILFTWGNYHKFTLQRLNSQNFQEVKKWVESKEYGYPCDLKI